jgi:hypothetical protein
MKQNTAVHKGRRVVGNSFKGNWIFRLDSPFSIVVLELRGFDFEAPWLAIDGKDGRATIPAEYAWDGCTPKFRIFDLGYVGTPDGVMDEASAFPITRWASLVHDALYQYYGSHGVPRRTIDRIFSRMLREAGFSCAGIYYLTVRAFGGAFFINAGIERTAGREYSAAARAAAAAQDRVGGAGGIPLG